MTDLRFQSRYPLKIRIGMMLCNNIQCIKMTRGIFRRSTFLDLYRVKRIVLINNQINLLFIAVPIIK